MQKASQKQEFWWEDFRKEDPPPIDYEAVKDFDSRFFYYDAYSMISESLLHSTSRSIEEEKFLLWAITEEDLETGASPGSDFLCGKGHAEEKEGSSN